MRVRQAHLGRDAFKRQAAELAPFSQECLAPSAGCVRHPHIVYWGNLGVHTCSRTLAIDNNVRLTHIAGMQIAEFMQTHSLDDEAMALRVRTPEIHCDRTMVSRYRRRVRRPDWQMIERIREVTDGAVTADDWTNLMAAE